MVADNNPTDINKNIETITNKKGLVSFIFYLSNLKLNLKHLHCGKEFIYSPLV